MRSIQLRFLSRSASKYDRFPAVVVLGGVCGRTMDRLLGISLDLFLRSCTLTLRTYWTDLPRLAAMRVIRVAHGRLQTSSDRQAQRQYCLYIAYDRQPIGGLWWCLFLPCSCMFIHIDCIYST